jgi:golgin subfamily B member 1
MGEDLNPDSTTICAPPSFLSERAPSNDARVAQANAQPDDGPADATDQEASEREALLQTLLDENPADADAHEALAKIFARGGRWSDVAELHAKRFDAIDNPHERAALLRNIANILREKFDDDGRAFEVLLDAFREDFADDETVRDLEAAARWTDRFGDLLVAANDWLRDKSIVGNDRVVLLARVGKWYGDDLGKPAWGMPYLDEARELAPNDLRVLHAIVRVQSAAGAIAGCEPVLRRILEIDPADREAVDSLERILLARGAIYDLVAFLEHRVRDSGSVALNALRVKLAMLHGTLPGGASRACELLEEAHQLDPDDVDVLRALDARYLISQRWPELATVLEERIERAETEDERVELLIRLAQLHEEENLDPDRAAQRLEQVVEIAPHRDDAFRALQRCYGKLRLWDAAVYAYERHIDGSRDAEARIASFTAMARVLLDELDVPDRALEAYASALDLDPDRISVLEAVARIHERQGDFPRALAMMEQAVERADDPARRVDALCRLAAIYRTRASDVVRARALYREALELDPTHLGALSALRQIALELDDVAEAVRLLDREQRHTAQPRVRAKLLVELAQLRRDRLDDVRGATHAYEEAHAADPENEDAAFAIASGCVERCEWSVVEPLLEKLAKSASRRPPAEQREIYAHLGRTYGARGESARALDALRRAYKLGANDPDILRALAEAAFVEGEYDEALSFQRKLAAVDEDESDRAITLHRLGEIHQRLGDDRRARAAFERALAANCAHRPSISALAELGAARGDWDEVACLEDRLIAQVDSPEERLSFLRESARRWADEAEDYDRAIGALETALTIAPGDRRLLLDLLRLRELIGDKRGVVATIELLVAIEGDGERRAKYRLTAAQLLRDLGDDESAVEACDLALDDDPTQLVAFRTIEELLTIRRDYAGLERAYRKMIHRVRGKNDAALHFELWHALGMIYRDRLNDPRASLEAFRMASRAKPDDSHERRIIAELCVATDRTDLAIAELKEAIAREPLDVAQHRALYRLYARTGELDRAYCVASALVFLKGADGEQRACYSELRPKGVPDFRARLGRAAWIRDLAHPALDRAIGGVFEVMARAVRAAKVRASGGKLSALAASAEENPAKTERLAAKAFFGAAAVFGMEPPQLFIRPDLPGGVTALPLEPMASLLGSTLLSGWTIPELMFVFGKHLATQQGEHSVRAHHPAVSELQSLLLAAVKIAVPSFVLESDASRRMHAALARELRADEIEKLGHVVSSMVEIGGTSDVTRWVQCSELTGVRAGLLLCGDLSVAAKILRQESVVAGDLSPNEKVKELLRFVVSEPYHQLRRSLGIDVRTRNVVASDDDDEPTLDRKLCA